jgi:hypothetical protein
MRAASSEFSTPLSSGLANSLRNVPVLNSAVYFGQRRYTSPFLEVDATNGRSNLLHNFFIFSIAISRAAAISASDQLPDAKTNSHTPFSSGALFSRKF